ncbi:MAG: autotransporter outer membrane beta-barrel domain-containing protein, partial [Alphaproteobacteria bacterium]|nr:autotransporter outer membrane beta-barrel domain-containing protein [Alphaproteobacteria bacterium]
AAKLSNIAQYHKGKLSEAVESLAPVDTPILQTVSVYNTGRIFKNVNNRLNNVKQGIASGDNLDGVTAWLNSYAGVVKFDKGAKRTKGFETDSDGISFGIDKKFSKGITAGLGYQYDDTDVDAKNRDFDIKTSSWFAYAQYKPSNWFVNTAASYSYADYKEKRYTLGQKIIGKYDVDIFALQALTGYDLVTKYVDIIPNAGLKYNYINRHTYTDSADQRVLANDISVLTAIGGLNAAKSFGDWRTSAYVNLVYDLTSNRDYAAVNLTNGAGYVISGKRLNRFAVEAGAAVEYNYNDWDFIAGYDYEGRSHFRSHTSTLTAKYHF